MNNRDRLLKLINAIFLLLLILSFGVGLSYKLQRSADFSFDDKSVFDWSEGWQATYGNTVLRDVSLPAKFDVGRGKSIFLKKSLPNKIKKYNCLLIESKRQDISVSVGGMGRSSYADKENRVTGKSSASGYLLVPLYTTDEGADIVLMVASDTYYSGDIEKIYLGNEMSIILMLLKKNIIWLIIIDIIVIAGLASLVSYINYRDTFEDAGLLFYLFSFALLAAVWLISELKIRQVFIHDIGVLANIGYSCFMLLPVPVLLFSNLVEKDRNIKIYTAETIIVLVNFVFEYIMQLTGKSDFFEMQIISRALFLSAIVTPIICILTHHTEEFLERHLYLLFSLTSLFIALLIDTIGTYMRSNILLDNAFGIGALCSVLINYLYIVISIGKEQRRKKDAENANMAKSQFLATMSHEIRTPINAVLGMNSMILRETNEPVVKEYADNIEDAGKSLLSLVNDILDFSKIESGKMDIVCVEYPMKTLLRDLMMMARARMADKKLRLKMDIDETIPAKYFGDEVRIKQIVTNLLTNAIKYTAEGEVTFSVKSLGIEDDKIKLYFSVKDTGIGITEENLELLKNSSFVRLDEAQNRKIEGTGLGLSITRRLLELMDSELEVESEYGKGSDFHFTIMQKIVDNSPMGSILRRDGEKNRKESNTFTAPYAKCLAVDDNAVNLKVIAGLMKPYESEVDTCQSGAECIEICKKKRYDLIFMDHMMPEMDGIETLAKLKKDNIIDDHTKIIALTANAVSGAAQLYKDSGFNGYMTKPIEVGELDLCLLAYLPQDMIVK